MGINGKVSRSTLADANEKRDWRIYSDFAQILIHKARKLYAGEDFGLELDETVYALDASTIELSLYTILQILGISVFEQRLISQALTPIDYKNKITSGHIQLNLFDS